MCACGSNDAYIRGYCIECVKKLRSKFDYLVARYAELEEEKNNFNPVDLQKSDVKLRAMRAKVERYQIKLTDAQMLDVLDSHARLTGTDENKSLQNLKVDVNSAQQGLEILQFKMNCEEADFEKQQEWFQERIDVI